MTQALYNIFIILIALTLLFSIWSVLLWRQKKTQAAQLLQEPNLATHHITLLYASQTGTAQHYAEQTAQRLGAQGFCCELLPLDQVTMPLMQQRHNILWLVSSYGDGDAPDHAQQFQHRVMAYAAELPHLHVAILGFGRRQYPLFCGFGKRLKTWLANAEATFLFEPIWVDAEQQDEIARWFYALETAFSIKNHGVLPVGKTLPEAEFVSCHLLQRDCLNPSFDGNLFRLTIAAPVALQWQAGDCLEVRVPYQDSAETRFYSIANIPEPKDTQVSRECVTDEAQIHDAKLQPMELLLRLTQYSTHTGVGYGVGSGYLTQQLQMGNVLQARIHVNQSLHHVAYAPALWLIAAGTGLAGALSQLRARAALGNSQNVLLAGERQAENLQTFQTEIQDWLRTGHLSRFELALSQQQCQITARYVTELLQAQKTAFLAHIQAGGFVYVCGRLDGVGATVDALLLQWLGQTPLDELKASHRYSRDVY